MLHDTVFIDVIVPLSVPNKFTYRVPTELNAEVAIGKRVIVQFGKTRFYTGIIYKTHNTAPADYQAKYIDSILDEQPIVTETQLRLWDWIAGYYLCNPGDVMNAALPSGLKLSSSSHITFRDDFSLEESDYTLFNDKEHLVLEALQHAGNMSFEDVSKLLQIQNIQRYINALIKKGAIVVYEEIKDKYKPKLVSYIALSQELLQNETLLHDTLSTLEKKAFKQAEVLLFMLQAHKSDAHMKETGFIKKSVVAKRFDASVINAMIKKNILIEQELETSRLLFDKQALSSKALNVSQVQAMDAVQEAFSAKKAVLLHGITGSGKTEIYIELIRQALQNNTQTLFLVPEIALTTQLITRVRAVFGEIVGIYHSRFSENERVEIWNSIIQEQQGVKDARHFKVILGARSALFLPFHKLGLIIVDEEHDSSYKQQDPAPRYHARDAALYLASLHEAHIILGTATPSFESYYNALQGKYKLVELQERFGNASLPETIICDLKKETEQKQNVSIFSRQLVDAMKLAIEKKEQIILFQNRRGFAPYTECNNCRWIPHCVHCDVALIYHKQQNRLVCHYCGYNMAPPHSCNACGSNDLRYKGLGTEKIEEEIEILFPQARTARMDLDTTRSKYAYKQLIDEFEAGNIDILVGTQMVTKGLDFNHVSVVGILNVDSMLNFPDFRSFEKAYQTIVQVSGRAGRKDKPGKVYIQTSQPQHPVILQVLNGSYPLFYQSLIAEREQFHYPPFTRVIEFTIISKDINITNNLAHEFAEQLRPLFGNMLLGPEFPLIARIKDQYHKRVLLKINRSYSPTQIRNLIKTEIDKLQYNNKNHKYRLQVDADPV
ncbi:MAG: primosomal protein N' [Bacteroidetes bacterium]|nr:primosomal protein N' [Bacteroidota bacterium]